MTANQRIAFNALASYGRSLYALLVGLFSARWVLSAMGHSDYGLYGLVGGLTAFMVFFNELLSSAVGRFYAYSVGKASIARQAECGIEECRRWFSIALLIHVIWPIVIVSIGYPVGVWAVESFLKVPQDRICSCVWVWRFTCLSSFVSMLNVPFRAMYNAKQEIAELTIYSFAVTTVNAFFFYYMACNQGFWLTKYAAWMCIVSVVPQLIICVRAVMRFHECRFSLGYAMDVGRIKSLLKFAGMNFVGAVSQMCSQQGLNIVVNRYLGTTRNAAMTIAAGINTHAASMSSSLFSAFHPAITNAAGAGDYERMRSLVISVCKYGTVCVMIFALPLILECDEILEIWLKNPPPGAVTLVSCYLVVRLIERVSDGHWVAIFAMGRITGFRIAESITYWLTLILAFCLIILGGDVACVGVALIVGRLGSAVVKLVFARKIAGLSIFLWFTKVFLPLMLIASVTVIIGVLPRLLIAKSFCRVSVTIVLCECALLPLIWFAILDDDDRQKVLFKVRQMI